MPWLLRTFHCRKFAALDFYRIFTGSQCLICFPGTNPIETRPHSFCRFPEPTLSRLRGIHDLEEVLVQEQLRALEAWTTKALHQMGRKITIHSRISRIIMIMIRYIMINVMLLCTFTIIYCYIILCYDVLYLFVVSIMIIILLLFLPFIIGCMCSFIYVLFFSF